MTDTTSNTKAAQNDELTIDGKKVTLEQAKEMLQAKSARNKVSVEAPDISAAQIESEDAGGKTLGSMMGEMVWLMSQSAGHKHLSLADLEWALMPPIILNQYKLFRNEGKPVGAALWGYLSEEAEVRLKAAGRLAPQDWGNNAQMDPARGLVPREGGTLWLVELIAPFHTEQNKHREQMLVDLIGSVFKERQFKFMQVNPESGQREEKVLDGNTNKRN